MPSQLGHYPASLAGNIGQGKHGDGDPIEPTPLLGDIAAPSQVADEEEEKHQQGSHTHHDAKGVEVDRYIGHQLGPVLDISIAEIRHIGLELVGQTAQTTVAGVGRPELAVLGQRGDGPPTARYLLLGRQFSLPVGAGIAIQDVIDTRHKSICRVGGQQ